MTEKDILLKALKITKLVDGLKEAPPSEEKKRWAEDKFKELIADLQLAYPDESVQEILEDVLAQITVENDQDKFPYTYDSRSVRMPDKKKEPQE